jgi:hypothetical protein
MSGSSQRSISGSSRRSISGSSQRSISGSSQRSISGSSRRSISGSSVRTANENHEFTVDFAAYGPLVAADDKAVTILGQVVSLAGSALDLASDVGKAAYVEGKLVDGVLSASRLAVFDEYVAPGASPVFVSGVVASVGVALGRIHVGSVEIDVTSVDLSIVEGDIIAVSGTQPISGGIVLSRGVTVLSHSIGNVETAAANYLQSISGSSGR